MENMDKELESTANKMIKGSKRPVKSSKPKTEPTDAVGWLRKAYIDNDPSDGAPKVGNIGYV